MRPRISLSLRFAPISSGAPARDNFLRMAGWEKWLDKITVEQQGDGIYYNVCKTGGSSGGTGGEAVELFCAGGSW